MACKIRASNQIRAFKVPGAGDNIKLVQLADDTTLFVNDEQSVVQALNIIEEFSQLAGPTLNRN